MSSSASEQSVPGPARSASEKWSRTLSGKSMVNVAMFLQDTRREPPKGIWVEHPTDGYSIKARPLYPWKGSEIRDQSRQQDGKIDDAIHNRLLTDWVVEDWKGIHDETGKKVACTLDNKLLLFENWASFNLFVQQCGISLEKTQSGVSEKN